MRQRAATGPAPAVHRTAMSTAERWMLRIVMLSLVALFVVLAIGHMPRGG